MRVLQLIVGAVVLVSFAQVLMKYSVRAAVTSSFASGDGLVFYYLNLIGNPYAWIGGILFIVASAMWLIALSNAELSYAYPIWALSYVIVAFSSWILFGEEMNIIKIFGIGVIVVGVSLLSKS